MSCSSVQSRLLGLCSSGKFNISSLNGISVVLKLLHCVHVISCVNIPVNRSQNVTIALCRFSSYVVLFSGLSDGWEAGWSSSSKHCLRPVMYSYASLEVGQDELFVSCKHEWKIYSFVHWVVMVFAFVLFKTFVTPVKSIQLLKIDNIASTTDQWINHRCKLRIELETFMLFIWWTLQEISNITIMGNSGDVSQGRCGGGAPYCGPRGARFN